MINEILMRDRPEVLFHYASTEGVYGICENKQIWASNIQYLNDSKEFKHAIELFSSEILNQKKNNSKIEDSYFERLLGLLKEVEKIQIFVASFSQAGDLLSQWRAYCPQGGGYSLGFDSKLLAAQARKQGFTLAACIYDEEEQMSLVKEALKTVETGFSDIWKENLAQFDKTFITIATIIAPSLKHPAFSEEKEWRLSTSPFNLGSEKEIKYQRNERLFVPYQEFNLVNRESQLTLKQVIVGPSETPDLSRQSLSGVLNQLNVSYGNLVNSIAPLRTW